MSTGVDARPTRQLSRNPKRAAHVARQRGDGLVLTFDEELRKAVAIRVPQV